MSRLSATLAAKRLELLREVVPGLAGVAVLSNPTSTSALLALDVTRSAARSMGVELVILEAQSADELPRAFETAIASRADALLTLGDALFYVHRERLAALATQARLPVIAPNRAFVDAGGLMNYGENPPSYHRRSASYVDRILRGARPADLPVEQPTVFDFVVSRTTANTLGLIFPPHVAAQVTEWVQ